MTSSADSPKYHFSAKPLPKNTSIKTPLLTGINFKINLRGNLPGVSSLTGMSFQGVTLKDQGFSLFC